jgi:hypothetical protein
MRVSKILTFNTIMTLRNYMVETEELFKTYWREKKNGPEVKTTDAASV